MGRVCVECRAFVTTLGPEPRAAVGESQGWKDRPKGDDE